MAKCKKLLEKAQRSPENFGFEELCALAECYGFVFRRQSGSHRLYKHPSGIGMNFQDRGGAKSYQVQQLLKAIESLAIEDSRDE